MRRYYNIYKTMDPKWRHIIWRMALIAMLNIICEILIIAWFDIIVMSILSIINIICIYINIIELYNTINMIDTYNKYIILFENTHDKDKL